MVDRTRLARSGALLACILLGNIDLAAANLTSPESNAPDAATITEEIVVTAQRRTENPLRVPITLRAISGEELAKRGTSTVQDLQILLPDLVVTTNTAFGQPYVRGVGSDLLTPGAESSIATFMDGVYQTRSALSNQDLFDIDRIELVKGPQGVLYGRNAVGGAINIHSRAPGDSRSAQLSATYGNFDKVRFEGAANLPVLNNNGAIRLSGLYTNRDGYTRNVVSGKRVNDENLYALRGQLRYSPNDNSEGLLRIHYSKEDSTRNVAPRINTAAGEAIADSFGAIRPDNTFATALDEDGGLELESGGVSLDYRLQLGGLELRSLSAYQESDLAIALDLDVSQLAFSTNTPTQKAHTFTQEFLLSSDQDRKFEWIAGAFFLSEEASQTLNVLLDFPAITGAPSGIIDSPGGDVDSTSLGLFFSARYELTPKWALNAGLRFSHDERDLNFLEQITAIADGSVLVEIQQDLDDTFSEWTPRLVAEYTPSDATLAYASISKGYKAGGFNTNVFQPEGFGPETLWAYEVGLKHRYLQGRATLETAVFHYDYDNLQLNTIPPGSPVGTFQIVVNAAEASVTGWEMNLGFNPDENWAINLGMVLLDAEFDDFSALNPNDAAAGETDRSGGRLPRAPELSAVTDVSYRWRWGVNELQLSANYRYESKQFLDIFQDTNVERASNSIVDAQLALRHGDDWTLRLWGKNLADEEIVQSAIRVDGLFGTVEFYFPPRTFGVTFEAGI